MDKLFDLIYKAKKYLIIFIVYYIFIFIMSLYNIEYIFSLLIKPMQVALNKFPDAYLVTNTLTEAFFLHIKISFIVSLISIIPIIPITIYYTINYFLNTVGSLTIKSLTIAILMFLIGISISYFFLIPTLAEFFISYTQRFDIKGYYNIADYLSFSLKLIFFSGLLMEVPVLLFLLAKNNIIRGSDLTVIRIKFYVCSLIISLIFSINNPIAKIMLLIPLISFFEVSVLAARIGEKK